MLAGAHPRALLITSTRRLAERATCVLYRTAFAKYFEFLVSSRCPGCPKLTIQMIVCVVCCVCAPLWNAVVPVVSRVPKLDRLQLTSSRTLVEIQMFR